jgi:hypothetical protein
MPIKEINCDKKNRKAIASLAIILSWKIRKERNGCFFRHQSVTTKMHVAFIKEEVKMKIWRV